MVTGSLRETGVFRTPCFPILRREVCLAQGGTAKTLPRTLVNSGVGKVESSPWQSASSMVTSLYPNSLAHPRHKGPRQNLPHRNLHNTVHKATRCTLRTRTWRRMVGRKLGERRRRKMWQREEAPESAGKQGNLTKNRFAPLNRTLSVKNFEGFVQVLLTRVREWFSATEVNFGE